MLRTLKLVAFLGASLVFPGLASADIIAHVDISEQRLDLYVDGKPTQTWKVSTGKRRNWTPTGTYKPYWLNRHHRSSLFNNAPMPYSVFFKGHYAIHGTNQIKRLGRPASHGCVRLHPKHAAILFKLIRKRGKANTVIHITH